MTITLGNGDFIITADSSDIERARAEIFGVMRRIDQRAEQTTELIDRRFTETANEITRQFEIAGANMERAITKATEDISDEVKEMGRDIERSVTEATAGLAEKFGRELAELRKDSERTSHAVGKDADSMGDAIGREIARGVALANTALAFLGDGSDRALHRITGLIGGLAKAALAAGALSASFAGLIQAVAAVAVSVENLLGILFLAPTAILGLVAILGTAKVAFKGVGDAIKEGLSGDMEKFSEALAKLSPAAQEAVTGLTPVFERMRALKTVVQDSMFVALDGQLAQFGTTAIGVAERAMPKLATSLGLIIEAFLRASHTSDFFVGVEAVLDRTAAGLGRLAGPIGHLTAAFGSLFLTGSGFVDRFYDSLGRLIDRFSNWIIVSADNGKMAGWIENSIQGFQQIGRILGNLGDLFSALNRASGTAGTGILTILENITARLSAAFSSDVGQSFLVSSFTLMNELMKTMQIVLGPLVELLARVVTIVNTQLASALSYLNPYLEKFAGWLGVVGESVTSATPQVKNFASGAVDFLAGRFRVLLDALSPIGAAVSGTGEAIKAAFAGIGTGTLDALVASVGRLAVSLAGVGSGALVALSGVFAELIKLSPRVVDLLGNVATILGSALVSALKAVTPLLDPILTLFEKLVPVLSVVGTAFTAAVQVVASLAVALAPLAHAIADAAGSLAGQLTPALKDMSSNFTTTAAPAIENVSRSLGEKLAGATEKVRPALQALLDGFRAMGEPTAQLIGAVVGLVAAFEPLTSSLLSLGLVIYTGLIPPLTVLAQFLFGALTLAIQILTPVVAGLSEVLSGPLSEAAEKLAPIFDSMSERLQYARMAAEEFRPVLDALAFFLSGPLVVALETFRLSISMAFDIAVVVVTVAWASIAAILETATLFLSGDFSGAWDRLQLRIAQAWNAIADYISDTVRRIITFLDGTGVSEIGRAAGSAFMAAYNAVVHWTGSALNAVIQWVGNLLGWFNALPGLIGLALWNAGSMLYDKGRDIVLGLINGLKSRAQDLVDTAFDWIVNPLKNALGGAAGFLFGSPSKVTAQYGKWISEGLAIGIESAEGSVVAAAESLTQAAALPGMTPGSPGMGVTGPTPFAPSASLVGGPGTGGVVFGPGAVQVVFQGAVPSEAEAFATGQAVGAGIADVIARRDARISVGVL